MAAIVRFPARFGTSIYAGLLAEGGIAG